MADAADLDVYATWGEFAPVFKDLLRVPGMTHEIALTFGFLAKYRGKGAGRSCHVRLTRIAEDSGIAARTVQRHVAKLKRLGLIRVENQRGRPNTYYFLPRNPPSSSDTGVVTPSDLEAHTSEGVTTSVSSLSRQRGRGSSDERVVTLNKLVKKNSKKKEEHMEPKDLQKPVSDGTRLTAQVSGRSKQPLPKGPREDQRLKRLLAEKVRRNQRIYEEP